MQLRQSTSVPKTSKNRALMASIMDARSASDCRDALRQAWHCWRGEAILAHDELLVSHTHNLLTEPRGRVTQAPRCVGRETLSSNGPSFFHKANFFQRTTMAKKQKKPAPRARSKTSAKRRPSR